MSTGAAYDYPDIITVELGKTINVATVRPPIEGKKNGDRAEAQPK